MTVTRLSNSINGTSASAPNLTGQAGSLVGVLDYCLVTTMGWTKSFSATNKASYKQPGGSNGFYLDVDDTASQNTLLRGYEAMTAIGTGTYPFPTVAQQTSGVQAYKSSTADATSRPWLFVSNGKIFYLLWAYNSTSTTGQMFYFGDIKSYKSADAYHTILAANVSANATSSSISACYLSAIGKYMPRSYTQTGTSINPTINAGWGAYGISTGEIGYGGVTYPAPVEGGIIITPLFVQESVATGLRGELPGLWCSAHARPLTSGDTFSGAALTPLSGKTFEAFSSAASGQILVETSDTWN